MGAAVLRHRRQGATRSVLRQRARRRLRRVEPAHAGGVRRGDRRVGAQRHEGVDHQRRHRRRARRRRRRRPRAEGPRARLVRGAARHEGSQPGSEVPQARHPCEPHRRGRARRRAGAGRVPARWQAAARREAGAGSRGRALGRQAAGDDDVRGDAPDRSARRRSASPAPRTSTHSTTPRSARRSAGRSS